MKPVPHLTPATPLGSVWPPSTHAPGSGACACLSLSTPMTSRPPHVDPPMALLLNAGIAAWVWRDEHGTRHGPYTGLQLCTEQASLPAALAQHLGSPELHAQAPPQVLQQRRYCSTVWGVQGHRYLQDVYLSEVCMAD